MSERFHRRVWQIHLSTAIVLMLAAAVLLGVNLYPEQVVVSSVTRIADGVVFPIGAFQYGWPVYCYRDDYFPIDNGLNLTRLLVNVLVAAFVLVLTVLATEVAIRRLESRKP